MLLNAKKCENVNLTIEEDLEIYARNLLWEGVEKILCHFSTRTEITNGFFYIFKIEILGRRELERIFDRKWLFFEKIIKELLQDKRVYWRNITTCNSWNVVYFFTIVFYKQMKLFVSRIINGYY